MNLNRSRKPIKCLLVGYYLADEFEERDGDCWFFATESDVACNCLAVLVNLLLLFEVSGDESLTASATLYLKAVQDEPQLYSSSVNAVVVKLCQRGQLLNPPPLLVHQCDLHRG